MGSREVRGVLATCKSAAGYRFAGRWKCRLGAHKPLLTLHRILKTTSMPLAIHMPIIMNGQRVAAGKGKKTK